MPSLKSLSGVVRERRRQAKRAQREYENSQARLRRMKEEADKAVLIESAGPRLAVQRAMSFTGTREQPANSNRGPRIDEWQKLFSPTIGYPWCGAFVGAILREQGVAVTHRIIYTPYILEDARVGRNGMEKIVPLERARTGDLVLFNFPGGAGVDHVGLVRGPWRSEVGLLPTVEGNTSSSLAGSQSNGGGVFERMRPRNQIVAIVRPRYKA